MLGLFIVYFLCAWSGALVERRLALQGRVQRVLLVIGVGFAQLMLCVQALSLARWLTGPGLVLANALATGVVLGLARRLKNPDGSQGEGGPALLADSGPLALDGWAKWLLGCAAAYLLGACLLGWAMLPYGDLYHNEMPAFWMQHHTALPFPVHNPRIVSVTFLSEAIAFPGYLYAGTPAMHAGLTILAMALALGVVFSLARRLGAGVPAAACAAAVTPGYSVFAIQPQYAAAGDVFSGVWFGASLLFLLDCRAAIRAPRTRPAQGALAPGLVEAGCSVLCFALACGCKNSTFLLSPLYLAALALALKGALLRPRFLLPLSACAVLAFASSGVPWNYLSNLRWFGNPGGSPFMQTAVAHNFSPASVWTRFCRGAVLTVLDPVWVPNSARLKYVAVGQRTAALLGAKARLPEDTDYSSFGERALLPRRGLGLVGVAFFLPGLLIGLARAFGRGQNAKTEAEPARFATRLLVVMTLGSFALVHLFLSWQCIGVLRLMLPFVVCGAPLAALLLEKNWLKPVALALLVISSAMFLVLFLGNAWRHLDLPGDKGLLRMIARLQNTHARALQYEWQGRPPGEFLQQEDYTMREVYRLFLAGIRQPCTIGIIGNENTECYYLFGPGFQNRLLCLVDARAPEKISTPSEGLDYLVAADRFAEAVALAARHGFEPLLRVSYANAPVFLAFKRTTPASR